MAEISIQINGRQQKHEAESRTHLGDFIREKSRLTGTNLSCEHGVCGACTVLVDGRPVRSCITFAGACDGHEVTTVEGYDDDPIMSRLRTAFSEKHALQCGFCTPGFVMSLCFPPLAGEPQWVRRMSTPISSSHAATISSLRSRM